MPETQILRTANLEAEALARIQRIDQAADQIVTRLGLPPEARYDLLAVTSGGRRQSRGDGDAGNMALGGDPEHPIPQDVEAGPAISNDAAWLHLWVKTLRELNQRDEALRYLTVVLTVPRGDATDFQNCAVEAEGLGALDLAIKLYERSLQLTPFEPRMLLNYADCLSKIAQRDGSSEAREHAEAIFAEVVAQWPQDARASSFYVDHFMRHEQLDEAKTRLGYLRQLALDNPVPDAARLYLGDLYSYHDRLGISKETIENDLSGMVGSLQSTEPVTVDEKSRLAALWAALASLYISLDNLAGATFAYEQAAALELTEPRALGNLALHLNLRLQAPRLAANVWRLALESAPEDQAIWEQILPALSLGSEVPPETMLKLLQTRSGKERLGLVSEVLGALPERQEILEEAQEVLRGRGLTTSAGATMIADEDEKKLRILKPAS